MRYSLFPFLILLSCHKIVRRCLGQSESICDIYAEQLFHENTAATQYLLITLFTNTALIGNYTTPNNNPVTGILIPDAFEDDTTVSLLKYFNGGLLSTNRGGNPEAVNFLDDGGAIPLAQNKPANGESSNQ